MSDIPSDAYVIIIGAMKSGTTSLYSYLAQHPGLCECRIKEPEYFSRYQSHGIEEKNYEELWDFDDTLHRYALDGSTGYTKYPMEKGVPERISKYGIDPMFIYILRDPFERIESHYNSGRFNTEWNHSIVDEHLINVSNYYLQLQCFRQFFSRDRFLLLDFKRMKTDPEKVLERIYDFLHLDHSFFPDSYYRKNETEYRTRLELLYGKLIRTTRISRIIPESLKKLGRRICNRATPVRRRLLTEEERKTVFDALEGDMIKLRDEYGFDVGMWGF
ncbi:MAG: sulfotransferase [Candidatus Aegiribacteria sp.]|nr:sulfotransferase [Candidatus Aegiribacteria sp.]